MNWGYRVYQRGRSDENYHRDACIAMHKMPCNEMSKKLATRYQCMKTIFLLKRGLKTSISRTYTLKKKNKNKKTNKPAPKNAITSIDLCPCHASRNLVLATYILVLFRNVTFVSLFAAK